MANILGKDHTYQFLKNALDASYIRQDAIANNIANVNTPHYKANRVIFEEELKKAMSHSGIGLRATHTHHIGIKDEAQGIRPKVVKDGGTTMRNDGNNVDIDLEMANLAANEFYYNTLIQQTNGKIGTLRYVINEGRR